MRQLFLAVLGAAGSLFLDLHALAVNTDTSTFIGEVSPLCEIEDLEENYELDWRLGGLRKSVPFTISSNTDVSISYKLTSSGTGVQIQAKFLYCMKVSHRSVESTILPTSPQRNHSKF